MVNFDYQLDWSKKHLWDQLSTLLVFPERVFQRELTERVGHVPNVLGRYHPMNSPTLNKKRKKKKKTSSCGMSFSACVAFIG